VPTSEDDLKSAAQEMLAWMEGPQPGEVYRHYKGGLYVVVCRSVHESGLDLLITYRSNARGTCWTRTFENFTGTVDFNGMSVARFVRVPF
jgi:hypothetical protein